MNAALTRKAALLVRFGLDLKKYNKNQEYKTLSAEYRAMPDFKETVDAVAEGLGLEVIDANESGIVLAVTTRDTPFAPTCLDISRQCSKAEYRQLMGICITAIAAVAYQRPGSLLSDAVQSVSVWEVEEKILAIADDIIAQGPTFDKTSVNAGLFEASQLIAKKRHISTTKTGEDVSGSLRWFIKQAFKYLEEQRLVKRDGDHFGGEYKTLSRFRATLANRGVSDAVTAVEEALGNAEKKLRAKNKAEAA